MKIILIGYMGSGKTTIGKHLSELLNYKFIDLDQVIEYEEQHTVSEIFSKKGELYFRKKERTILETILSSDSNIVLATGGGTPCFGDTMEFMKSTENTITIYLKSSNEELTKRLFNERLNRPLIAHIKSQELLNDFIRKHLFERSYFYNQSDIKLSIDDLTVAAVVEEINKEIRN
ncbi:MAG: AAA family ATPase [Flavobacteriaceae bacterium]|mgnify:FL=1|jgi:shikimate kinase|nr:AAA family ATPase [Flavobacteriaceae bacterium]MBT3920332.1 AAA family ATPase [Flavobacteriaceae bacterium]MBT6704344.1 AAA family ATPase [Flavobacteriaceae bacterium]